MVLRAVRGARGAAERQSKRRRGMQVTVPKSCICRGEEYFQGEWLFFVSPSCPVHGLESAFMGKRYAVPEKSRRKVEDWNKKE